MSLVVVDASVFAAFYAADDPRQPLTTDRLSAGDALFTPAHMDAEVLSALRGMARGNPTLNAATPAAVKHLASFPIRRMPLPPLLERMWELRGHITPYDAAYVALAERLGCVLATCDTKLAAVGGTRCRFEVIA